MRRISPQARFREALLVSDQISDLVSPDRKIADRKMVDRKMVDRKMVDRKMAEIFIPSSFPIFLSTIFLSAIFLSAIFLSTIFLSAIFLSDACSYSWRNETSGSTFVARRAGMRQEIIATVSSSKVIA